MQRVIFILAIILCAVLLFIGLRGPICQNPPEPRLDDTAGEPTQETTRELTEPVREDTHEDITIQYDNEVIQYDSEITELPDTGGLRL